MNGWVWLGVALLGGAGAVLRFLADGAISARLGRTFPYGTLVVNGSGALALGVLAGVGLAPRVAVLAGTALLGSYTTFSTWMFETQRLGEEQQVAGLTANLVVSLLVGLVAAALGRVIGAAW